MIICSVDHILGIVPFEEKIAHCHLACKIYVCAKSSEFLAPPICLEVLSDFSYRHALWQWDLDNHARFVWFLCGCTISTICCLCCYSTRYPRAFDVIHVTWNPQSMLHQTHFIHTYVFDVGHLVQCECMQVHHRSTQCNAMLTQPTIPYPAWSATCTWCNTHCMNPLQSMLHQMHYIHTYAHLT